MALPDLGTFDPGAGDGWDESPLSTVDKLKRAAARAALDYNPLTALRTLQDAPRIAYNATVAPLASMWSVPAQGLQNKGAELLYGALGDTENAKQAAARNANLQPADLSLPLQSASGQAAQDALGQAFDESKLAGAIGLHMPASRGFTPNDLRVVGAEAARIGKQVRDIPADFANAKAGITRIDPITNAPTLGTKLQSIAPGLDTIGELGPTPGSSAAQMGAVRVSGTQVARAKDPMTGNMATPAQVYAADLGGVEKLVTEPRHSIDMEQPSRSILGDYSDRYLGGTEIESALKDYTNQRMMEMYPDAPSPRQATHAFESKFGGRSSTEYADAKAQIISDFVKTPEAQRIAQAQGSFLPDVEDYFNRHNAAMQWVSTNLPNYVSKFVGTANDPLLKAASEGYTFLPAADVMGMGRGVADFAQENREKAGMPVSALQSAIDAKQAELDKATQDMTDVGQANIGNLEATNTITRAQEKRKKVAQELENLKLGAAYENLSDAAISPTTKEAFLGRQHFKERQFFPDITHPNMPADATVYAPSLAFSDLALGDIAKTFYNDVMQGKIAHENLSAKMPVDKYVRQTATNRMQEEARAAAAKAAYLDNATAAIAARNAADPEAQIIGNAQVLETTSNTPPDVALQRASDATAVLDHCVGQGGRDVTFTKAKHPFTGNSAVYEPILDPVTGKKNPNSSRTGSSYVDSALNGGAMLAHFNDGQTKLPVATLQLHKDSNGYSLGYVSGPTTSSNNTNGPIDPKYHQAIADYLNKRGDITQGGGNLADNTSVLDLKEDRAAARILGLRRDEIAAAHPDLPRFMTENALKDYAATLKQEQQATPQLPTARSTDTLQSLQEARAAAFRDLNDLTNTQEQVQDAMSRITDIDARIARIGTDQRLATNYATPSEYNFNDFAGVYGDNLTPNERRAGQAAVDYIHHYFDERSLQDNYLYARQQVGSPALDEVRYSDEALRVLAGLSGDTQDAVREYFRDLPGNTDAAMPRILTRMTDEDLNSQLSDADRARVPELTSQMGQHFDRNRQHYPTVLAFVDEMRHDRPLAMPTQEPHDAAVLESALRQLAHERMAGAPAAQAPAAPTAIPDILPDIHVDDWEVDQQHGANQPAAAAAAPQEDALAARMERLRNGEFAASLDANLRTMQYGALSSAVLQTPGHFNLVADAATRILEQTQTHGIDNPDEVTNLIRNGNNVFGGATLQLDTFTPEMLELLARDVDHGMTARNNALGRRANEDARVQQQMDDFHERTMANAQEVLEILDESVFSTMARPTALRQIRGSIRQLENNGREGWENVLGMASEDYPYSTTLRDAVLAQLNMLLESYE